MTTVTIGVFPAAETEARMLHAIQGEDQGAFISFASAELLCKVINLLAGP